MATTTQFIRGTNLLLKNTSNFTTNVYSSSSMASNLQITLPSNLGNADTFLQTNGSGITSWSAAYSTNPGPTGPTGQPGANSPTGSTGPTGPTGVSAMTNVYLYEATNATISSVPIGNNIPITQFQVPTSGITWSTDTATVLYSGVYSIYFFFRATAGNVGTYGISINGAAPLSQHRIGVNPSTGGIDGSQEVIIQLNVNDTISVQNLDSVKTYSAYSTGLSCLLNIIRITT